MRRRSLSTVTVLTKKEEKPVLTKTRQTPTPYVKGQVNTMFSDPGLYSTQNSQAGMIDTKPNLLPGMISNEPL